MYQSLLCFYIPATKEGDDDSNTGIIGGAIGGVFAFMLLGIKATSFHYSD